MLIQQPSLSDTLLYSYIHRDHDSPSGVILFDLISHKYDINLVLDSILFMSQK